MSAIPGFYYDRERKRYFKILPNQHSSTTNSVTKETIRTKEDEEKRQKFIHDMPNKHYNMSTNIAIYTRDRQLLPPRHTVSDRMKLMSSRLQSMTCSQMMPSCSYDRAELMLAPPSSKYVLCLVVEESSIFKQLHKVKLIGPFRKTETIKTLFSTRLCSPTTEMCENRGDVIHDACLCPSIDHEDRVLMITVPNSVSSRRSQIFIYTNHTLCSHEVYYNKSKIIWSCAWDSSHSRYSLGLETYSLVRDMKTHKNSTKAKTGSRVTAQAFEKTGSLLFSGTQSGNIHVHDTRSQSKTAEMTLHQQSYVCCLRTRQNENHIIASDMNGALKQWDLRRGHVVQEWRGNYSEYARLPFEIDETYDIIYTTGQDSYTRIWSLSTSDIICELAPPYPASSMGIPRVLFSDSWGGRYGNVGFLMAVKNEFIFYSF